MKKIAQFEDLSKNVRLFVTTMILLVKQQNKTNMLMKNQRPLSRGTCTATPTIDNSMINTSRVSSARCHTPQLVQWQIQQKINTFTNWEAHSYLRSRKTQRNKAPNMVSSQVQQDNVAQLLLKFAKEFQKKQQINKKLHHHKIKLEKQHQKAGGITQSQRQKFKRMNNPLQFLSLYQKSNKFNPLPHQSILVQKLIQIKALIQSMDQNINLERVLNQIYKFINMVVDFNEMRLLIVGIRLAADICLEAKDLSRATFYYDQARIASLYAGLPEITVQALIGLAKITSQLNMASASVKLIKKALAYAWQQCDRDSETQIYDLLGQTYCLEGKVDKADYYHERSQQNYLEPDNSAIRKIYIQIIRDDSKGRNLRLYGDNVDILFLETLKLPILSFDRFPEQIIEGTTFDNAIDGHSPRGHISARRLQDFDPVEQQLSDILTQPQFVKEMPNPDVQNIYKPSNRYGRKRRDVPFGHTLEFHEIIGQKIQVSSPKAAKKYSIQKQIEIALAQKPNPKWYEQMSRRIKRERLQKLGDLKTPTRRTHLKTQQRKRSLSTQSQNIRNSVNKAIISWIDPLE